MKKIKAFTLIEVMISIFVFSSAMLGFMAFHAHTMAVLFENESTQLAHSLAFNLVDEINAMSYKSFGKLTSNSELSSDWVSDSNLTGFFGSNFKPGPFNSFGQQVSSAATGNYIFHRAMKIDTYSKQTQVYVQDGTYLSTLYHVEVRVTWPKKEYPTKNCGTSYSSTECNILSIPLVRSDENYEKGATNE
ncbi:MAG: prepilin-type N-terminal cleavage/methylation domain-containing protein [Spirochaetaceae bacterium]|nr:prepilin-type N-terminal cleavage/methylation domain-containing protein [Spirochaetaceae bacterium]